MIFFYDLFPAICPVSRCHYQNYLIHPALFKCLQTIYHDRFAAQGKILFWNICSHTLSGTCRQYDCSYSFHPILLLKIFCHYRMPLITIPRAVPMPDSAQHSKT